MQLRNGDFGDSLLELRSYWLKATCLNGNIGQSYMREVHLGSRLAQEIVFSIETVNKDTETRALMVRDTMRWVFSEKNRQFEEAQIVEASGKTVDLKDQVEHLPKLGVTKTEKSAIEQILMKRDPNDGVEGSPSVYLMANAISAHARTLAPERSRELQQISGSMLFTKKPDEVDQLNFK